MRPLGSLCEKIRSKNAGPFWITIDIFCGDRARFDTVAGALDTDVVAETYGVSPETIKRFEIETLSVIKLSFPRPVPQAALEDRDQHGAQYAVLLEELLVQASGQARS